jgi:hypothetical protein
MHIATSAGGDQLWTCTLSTGDMGSSFELGVWAASKLDAEVKAIKTADRQYGGQHRCLRSTRTVGVE